MELATGVGKKTDHLTSICLRTCITIITSIIIFSLVGVEGNLSLLEIVFVIVSMGLKQMEVNVDPR